jgi:hypothetical protein
MPIFGADAEIYLYNGCTRFPTAQCFCKSSVSHGHG